MVLDPKFQLQLADTNTPYNLCARCGTNINPMEDPEHIILKPISANNLFFHVAPCFGEFLSGATQFFKIFIVEKQKRRKLDA